MSYAQWLGLGMIATISACGLLAAVILGDLSGRTQRQLACVVFLLWAVGVVAPLMKPASWALQAVVCALLPIITVTVSSIIAGRLDRRRAATPARDKARL